MAKYIRATRKYEITEQQRSARTRDGANRQQK